MPPETTSPTPRRGNETLIAEVLARRNDTGSGAWTASVRRALSPSTEVGAYGSTERHLHGLPEAQARGARRAAAICAGARRVPYRRGSLGADLRRLDRALGGNRVEQRVGALPLLDLENAAQALGHLVDLCAAHGVTVDFYDLSRTLTAWGDGIDPRSQETRRRLVADFYGTPDEASDTDTTSTHPAQEGTL